MLAFKTEDTSNFTNLAVVVLAKLTDFGGKRQDKIDLMLIGYPLKRSKDHLRQLS